MKVKRSTYGVEPTSKLASCRSIINLPRVTYMRETSKVLVSELRIVVRQQSWALVLCKKMV